MAMGAGAGQDTLRVPGPVSAPLGTDLPPAGCWGRAGWCGGTGPAAGTWQQGSAARLSRALNPARGTVSRQPAVS